MNNRVDDNLIHSGANEPLVRALTAAGVRFVVVGGLAMAWHCPEREADDLDLLVEPTLENSANIAEALEGLGLTGFSNHSFARPGLQVPMKSTYYADLLTPREGSPTFPDIHAQAANAMLFNIPVRLASVSTLLAMKRQAVDSLEQERDKHIHDIELLEDHRSQRESRPRSVDTL